MTEMTHQMILVESVHLTTLTWMSSWNSTPVEVKTGATLQSLPAPEYMISIAKTPDHGRTVILDASKTVGRIEVR